VAHHRNVNAARNILRLGLQTLAGRACLSAGKLRHSRRGAVIRGQTTIAAVPQTSNLMPLFAENVPCWIDTLARPPPPGASRL
jgi:hypothetical protein